MPKDRRGLRPLVAVTLILLLVLVGVPALIGLVMAFKESSIMLGLMGSSWVGLKNFQQLFADPGFAGVMTNTLVVTLLPHLALVAVALASALAAGRLEGGRAQGIFLSLVLLVSFLPPQLWLALLRPAFLSAAAGWRPAALLFMGLATFLRRVGLAALVGAAGAALAGRQAAAVQRFGGAWFYALAGLATLFTPGEETFLFQGPAGTDTTLTYAYRQGMMMMNVGPAAALGVLKGLLQLAGAALAAVLVVVLARRGEAADQGGRRALSKMGVGVLIGAGVLLVAGVVAGFTGAGGLAGLFSLLIVVLAMVLFCAMAVPAALASPGFGRAVVPAVLLLFAAIAGLAIPEYYFISMLGLVNTVAAPAVMAAPMVILLAIGAWMFYVGGRRALMYALPLAAYAAGTVLNSLLAPLYTLMRADMFPLSLSLWQDMLGMAGGTGARLAALCLLSLALWAAGCAFLFPGAARATGGQPLGQPAGRPQQPGVWPPHPPAPPAQ